VPTVSNGEREPRRHGSERVVFAGWLGGRRLKTGVEERYDIPFGGRGGVEAARVIARKSLVIGKLLRRAHD